MNLLPISSIAIHFYSKQIIIKNDQNNTRTQERIIDKIRISYAVNNKTIVINIINDIAPNTRIFFETDEIFQCFITIWKTQLKVIQKPFQCTKILVDF